VSSAPSPVRSLLFSTLYPSSARPTHGIFVETRLRELLKRGGVDSRVVAPVPWFPLHAARFGDYARMAQTPARACRHGIDVRYPRYPVIPKIGMSIAPWLLALSSIGTLRRMIAEGFDFDLIDAHYFYPDGVAAALLARVFNKPLVITARGSDVNLIAGHSLPRRMMLRAAQRASALVGVSAALVERMAALGMPGSRLHMLRNGVDLQLFKPLAQAAARAELGLQGGPFLLSVGNLLPLKGHALCIDALAALSAEWPAAQLLIVGRGPEEDALRRHAAARGVADRVRLVGAVDQAALARWYSAADVLLLASSREGWPNVLLESMACGTPVVATRVGGVPEVVQNDTAGRLVERRDGQALADAVRALLRGGVDRGAVRRYAEGFDWQDTSDRQVHLFQAIATAASNGAWGARHA
jgi:glycosyltransferase involved in cell wall biosynthesis